MADAFRPLPFQYQQRGPDLAEKLKDPDTYKKFTEQRDQDLENYLANLKPGDTFIDTISFQWRGYVPSGELTAGNGFDSSAQEWNSVGGYPSAARISPDSGLTLDDFGNIVMSPGTWSISTDILALTDPGTPPTSGTISLSVIASGLLVSSTVLPLTAAPVEKDGGYFQTALTAGTVIFVPDSVPLTVTITNLTDVDLSVGFPTEVFTEVTTVALSGTRVSIDTAPDTLVFTP